MVPTLTFSLDCSCGESISLTASYTYSLLSHFCRGIKYGYPIHISYFSILFLFVTMYHLSLTFTVLYLGLSYISFSSFQFHFPFFISQNPLFFSHTPNLSQYNNNFRLFNHWIVVKFEYQIGNIFSHIPTIGIF